MYHNCDEPTDQRKKHGQYDVPLRATGDLLSRVSSLGAPSNIGAYVLPCVVRLRMVRYDQNRRSYSLANHAVHQQRCNCERALLQHLSLAGGSRRVCFEMFDR
jgi:hypothetical protein